MSNYKKIQISEVTPPNLYKNLNHANFYKFCSHHKLRVLSDYKHGVLLQILSFWAKHSEFTPKFGALRLGYHFCSLKGWKILSGSRESQHFSNKILVTKFWSQHFGHKIFVKTFWSQHFGHQICSQHVGQKMLVTKFGSQNFGHNILVTKC